MNFKDFPLVLKASDVANIMGVSVSTAYEYMKLTEFPSFKMPGKRGSVRVMRDQLFAWMMERGEEKIS